MSQRVRRRAHCIISVREEPDLDVDAFLGGTVRFHQRPRARLLCSLTGEAIALTRADLTALSSLDGGAFTDLEDASRQCGSSPEHLWDMVERGVLVASPGTHALSDRLLDAEARQTAIGWHPLAAVYQTHTGWSAMVGREGERDHSDAAHRRRLETLAQRRGPPPPHFHVRQDAGTRHRLPAEPFDDPFAEVFRKRRTCRHFDALAWLPQEALGRVLRGTFGALGTAELAPGMVAVKRSSASGGALHPVDAYLLVIRVEGLAPGWYHYRGDLHGLDELRTMGEDAARELVSRLTIGQHYFAEAHALAFHVARIDRHHWKYRDHPKALKAVMMDTGHLSQTFYLLAAERGLGAFFTAAINDRDAAAELGLDPLREIVLGANGVGVIDPSRNELDFVAAAFTPKGDET